MTEGWALRSNPKEASLPSPAPLRSRLSHLDCSHCDDTFPFEQLNRLCPSCSRPLLARYNLEFVPRPPHSDLPGMWRYSELLPHRGQPVTLGEGNTPVLAAPRLGAQLQLDLLVKDESQNPTTSFKSRGLAAAVTMALALGAEHLAIPTAGNAGGALAAYAARAGLPATVFMPRDTPEPFALEARLHGAQVEFVDGLITDCGQRVAAGIEEGRWFDISTLKEPYRLEGKKTMGYEIWEQCQPLPDVILYPTGGGTGLVGIWKALDELAALGWYEGPRPKMVVVQVAGCAPIVRAHEQGAETAEPWVDAETLAYGLRVPAAVGDRLMLETVRDSGGTAIAVPERAMLEGMQELSAVEGIPTSPETGALVAAARQLKSDGWLSPGQRVLLISTASGHKYPDSARAVLQE